MPAPLTSTVVHGDAGEASEQGTELLGHNSEFAEMASIPRSRV